MSVLERITASATRIITRSKGGSTKDAGLQTVAWDMWQTVPEVGTYADWVSNTMTGARLVAGRRGTDGEFEAAPDNSRAAELVRSIAGGLDGQSEMLGMMGSHLAVAGETWLVIIPDPNADSFADDRWIALSSEEVKKQRGKIKVTVDGEDLDVPEPDRDTGESNPDDPVGIRIWDSSPRRHWDATSPVMRAITVLEELRLLNAAVAAIARSRITGRGVLLVPAGTRFPTTPGGSHAEDSLLDIFIEVASTAIREPESAAATVPIVLEVPGDLISGTKWLQFGSEFDSLAIQLREEAIRRFATGADVPAEVLLGMGDVNHWGAWALTAEALKTGAEPRLSLICNALTEQWLRPLLEFEKSPDAGEWMVWYDTSGLRSSSNKSATAIEAFQVGLISGEAARRELGFTDDDAPTGAEPAAPDTEGTTLPVNDIQTEPALAIVAAQMGATQPVELRIEPGEGDRTAALTAAVDGLAWAALAEAGRRIMRTPACPRPARGAARELVATASVHTQHPVQGGDVHGWKLLDGAWERVPEIAARYGVDPGVLEASLHGYAFELLTSGQPHTYDNTVRMLAQSGLVPSTLIGMIER